MKKVVTLLLMLTLLMGITFVVALGQPNSPSDFGFNPNIGMIIRYYGSGGKVVIPETINGILVKSIAPSAFYECTNITSVFIPRTMRYIGNGAFYCCTNMKEVYFAGDSQLRCIDNGAFCDCSSLAVIMLPEQLRNIGENAFKGCSSLVSLVIPGNVENIEKSAFADCKGLQNVVFLNDNFSLGNNIFDIWYEDISSYMRNLSLRVIIYPGSRAQWDAIVQGSINLTLENNPRLDVICEG